MQQCWLLLLLVSCKTTADIHLLMLITFRTNCIKISTFFRIGHISTDTGHVGSKERFFYYRSQNKSFLSPGIQHAGLGRMWRKISFTCCPGALQWLLDTDTIHKLHKLAKNFSKLFPLHFLSTAATSVLGDWPATWGANFHGAKWCQTENVIIL